MSLALSRKASPTVSPTLTSFATTRPARSRASIAIGTTPPSTRSWRALCREIPSKDGIGQTLEESGARRRAFEERNLRTILSSGGGLHESVSENLRRTEGAVRHGRHAHLRMARRSTRSHGPHDPGERGALSEGDGEGVQDRIAGIHLRDCGIGWRERGPEEPAERVDEAGRST